MSSAQINRIRIQGFRAFGAKPQELNLEAPIVAIWGPNSQGKSSLAEAFEFLLSGSIVRRTLMASAKDEFADGLRNVHLADDVEVFVEAEILKPDGSKCMLKRTLTRDFAKRETCASALQVDGIPADEGVLAELGIKLSQPPFQAPVLAHHTLSYLFSARPQERADYFKAILEVTDLETFRNDVNGLSTLVAPVQDDMLDRFEACLKTLDVHLFFVFHNDVPTDEQLADSLDKAVTQIVRTAGEEPSPQPETRREQMKALLQARLSSTFPLDTFKHSQAEPWICVGDDEWTALQTFRAQFEKIGEEFDRLTALFAAALKLPALESHEADEAADCPLCEAEKTLTPERMAVIREHVESSAEYQKLKAASENAIDRVRASLDGLAANVKSSYPKYLGMTGKERRAEGFSADRIRELLGPDHQDLVSDWLEDAKDVVRCRSDLRRRFKTVIKLMRRCRHDPSHSSKLIDAYQDVAASYDKYRQAMEALTRSERRLLDELQPVVAVASQTEGWEELLKAAENPAPIRAALIERHAREVVQKELAAALRQIDRQNGEVLQEKFAALSREVADWWNILRPEEPTRFESLQPRSKTARRIIDFKAELVAENSAPKIRDVIAVFSQSQLHCLGLALFLARALHEGTRFLVLDDPILSSDEDYRVHFRDAALNKLITRGVRVVFLTQDKTIWSDVQVIYEHKGIKSFRLKLDDPTKGTVLDESADEFLEMLSQAEPLTRSDEIETRRDASRRLRTAAELFCKLLLVKKRKSEGNDTATISDYQGMELGKLEPLVLPHLDHQNGDRGKLTAMRRDLNPGNHHATPPTKAALRNAWGNLKKFYKTYLKP